MKTSPADSNCDKPVDALEACEAALPYRILVVDDEPIIREIITEVLTHSGYHVEAAGDGADAWEALQNENFNLLITDQNMPRVTGVELLKKVHAAHLKLPVIMASGTLPTQEFSRQPWLQPEAMLLKPFTFALLLDTVRQVLRSSFQHASPSTWERPLIANDWES